MSDPTRDELFNLLWDEEENMKVKNTSTETLLQSLDSPTARTFLSNEVSSETYRGYVEWPWESVYLLIKRIQEELTDA